MKKLKGARTLILAVVAAVPLFLEIVLQISAAPEWMHVIPPQWLPHYGLAIVFLKVLMRHITDGPPSWRRPSE